MSKEPVLPTTDSKFSLSSPCSTRSRSIEHPFSLNHLKEISLLITCKNSPLAIDYLCECIKRIMSVSYQNSQFQVFIEEQFKEDDSIKSFISDFIEQHPRNSYFSLSYWPSWVIYPHCDRIKLPHIDLILSLGGDGTVLYSAWQFQSVQVPPILPVYAYGTLGFLTVFDIESCNLFIKALGQKEDVSIENTKTQFNMNDLILNMRMRLQCTIIRERSSNIKDYKEGSIANPTINPCECLQTCKMAKIWDISSSTFNLEKLPDSGYGFETFHVLNEVVIDRGPSPFMTSLELYGNDLHLTTVQADGLIIATPTGSTAYSMSANGPIVYPSIPSILISPICPHSLSFRPLLLPDTMMIKIVVPEQAKSIAWASFDGRQRVELNKGDYMLISVSNYPVPTLSFNPIKEWFQSLSRCLSWNERHSH